MFRSIFFRSLSDATNSPPPHFPKWRHRRPPLAGRLPHSKTALENLWMIILPFLRCKRLRATPETWQTTAPRLSCSRSRRAPSRRWSRRCPLASPRAGPAAAAAALRAVLMLPPPRGTASTPSSWRRRARGRRVEKESGERGRKECETRNLSGFSLLAMQAKQDLFRAL